MDFEAKNEKDREKNSSQNDVFFECIFILVLGGFGEDFGRVWGGVWSLLAPLGPLFGVIFWGLYPECSPEGLLNASGLHFGSILEGLGGVRGRFWEGFGRVWRVKNCVRVGPRFWISCSGCCCFWRGLGRRQDALRYDTLHKIP